MQVDPKDCITLLVRRELYMDDPNGQRTSLAEEQAFAYALGQQRALHDYKINEMRRLLEQISRAHSRGLPRMTRERIAAVLA